MKSRWASRSARLCFGTAWSLLFATLFVASDDPQKDSANASLTFLLPADAVLEIQNKKIEGSGESRRESVAVAAEGETVVAVKASWMECDTKRQVKRSLRLTAGQEMEVDLNLDPTADEKMIFAMINKEREKAGLAALEFESKLNRAARAHSLNMAKQNKLSHSLDGKGPPERLKDVGYRLRTFGENVAFGARTPAAAVQQWMTSQAHKENILTAEFTETGIGIANGPRGQKYYTQVFGTPAK